MKSEKIVYTFTKFSTSKNVRIYTQSVLQYVPNQHVEPMLI